MNMPDSKQEIAHIIAFGIKTEIEGQNFYSTLAKKIVNPDARKKIEQLAADEVNHERRLRNLYVKCLGSEATELPAQGLGIFKDAFGDKPLSGKDTFRLIELAMEAERLSAKHYKSGEDKASDREIREVFAELVAEEDSHYALLAAERESLRGHTDWFSYDGSAMMEE
jgi:rubrerythrin